MDIDIIVAKNGVSFTADELVELWHSVGWHEGSAEHPARLQECIKNSVVVYAKKDDKLIGLCASITDGLNVFISYMLVNKDYQILGIGGELLDKMVELFPNHRIHVETRDAKKFYEKHGFCEKPRNTMRLYTINN